MKTCMFVLLLTLAGSLAAQQISVSLDGAAFTHPGSAIELGSFPVNVPTRVGFTLHNNSANSLEFNSQGTGLLDSSFSRAITISGQVNCAAILVEQPALSLAAGASRQLFLEITAHEIAPLAFTVQISDGLNTNAQNYTGSGAESSTVWLLGVSVSAKKNNGRCSTGEESGLWLLGAAMLVSLAVYARRRPAAE